MSGSTTWSAGIPSPTDPRIATALTLWVDAAEPDNAAGALAAIVARVAQAVRLDVALAVDGRVVEPTGAVFAVEVDEEVLTSAGPWLPGFAREALISAGDRRREGVHHTTPAMASTLVEFVADLRPFGDDDLIVDPAVGGGVFLLAAAVAMDGDRAARVGRLRGFDIDPLAVATTEAALRLWADGAPVAPGAISVRDALDGAWPEVDGPAAVVIGNPPFRSQLRGDTGRDEHRRASLARRWPEISGYVDDAAAFLLAGTEQVCDGGVVALVQPSSFLSARDAEPVRARLCRDAPPAGLWIDGGQKFAASVDTVAVLVRKGGAGGPIRRIAGVPGVGLPDHPPVGEESWASLLLVDTPHVASAEISFAQTLADVAHVTAGFRDQFYGLRGAVSDRADGRPRLITSGLIDPLECRWGRTSCRFDKQTWQAPTVDPAAVDPAIRTWVADRLTPKLVVASQTRVLEVAIDAAGDAVPCTPVITVEPRRGAPSLAHLAAALTSPVVSLLLLRSVAGSALSADAMRVSARALADLPLPVEGPAWDAAAAAVDQLDGPPSRAELVEIGRRALAAYGLADRVDVLNWWQSRLRGR
ncbi:MAG: N-6 DNA methylase [Acidimicrobiales bacterium]